MAGQLRRRVVREERPRLARVGVVLGGMRVVRAARDRLRAQLRVAQQRGRVEPRRRQRERLLAAEAGAARIGPALGHEALATAGARRRPDEREALDAVGVFGGQFEGDRAAHAVARHARLPDLQPVQQLRGVVGHARDRVGLVGGAGAARAAVVEGDDAPSEGERPHLRRPQPRMPAQPRDQQERRSRTGLLVVGDDVPKLYVRHDGASLAGPPAIGYRAAGPTSPRRSASSMIWTTFVAAPLRMLSVTAQSAIAPGREPSARMRPTSTSSAPAASTGVG